MFETETDVLEWYEKQPRALSREFISNVNQRVKRLPGMDQLRSLRERIETIATAETTKLTAEA